MSTVLRIKSYTERTAETWTYLLNICHAASAAGALGSAVI